MLSKSVIRAIGLRVKMMSFSDANYYIWDKKREQLEPDRGRLFGMYHAFSACMIFCIMHLGRIYIALNFHDIPDVEEQSDPHRFATLIVGYGEVALVLAVAFLMKNTLNKTDVLMYFMNQMLQYNKQLREMIARGELTLQEEQKEMIRVGERALYLVLVISAILPIGIVGAITVPFEPTHVMLKQLLEVDFSLRWEMIPFVVLTSVAMYNCATTICLVTIAVSLYYLICIVCMDGITPVELLQTKGRCKLKTKCFNVLDDEQVMRLYRIQQVFSGLMGAFFKSVIISFHHVAMLSTICVVLCLVLRFGVVLQREGWLAYVVVIIIIFAVLAMSYYQSSMGGAIVDVSSGFRDRGEKVVPRKHAFRKFLRSCQSFSIPVAHPFYIVHKDTFLSFCQQVLDNTVTLLFW